MKRLPALVLCAAAGIVSSPAAESQTFPEHPLKIVVPQGAGGPGDTNARIFAEKLSQASGQPVYIENKPGGSTIIGAESVARSAPNGYTLLFASVTTLAVNPSLFQKLSYDPVNDFTPLAMVTSQPFMLVTHAKFPANNVQELIALARAKPGTLNYGSSGSGTSGHITGAFFASEAGIDITHVPYKSAGTVQTDLMAGRIDLAFRAIDGALLAGIKANQLKVLGTSGTRRSPLLPDVPTIAEQGVPGFESSVWSGFVVPSKTPKAVSDALSSMLLAIAADPAVRQKVAANGGESTSLGQEAFGALIKSETVKWEKVVRSSGATVE
ncbi:Tripartite tricarboxylate transporter family receptor [Pigmentiphaga humi]|uniref:Tripartite tricarboxylate transporter family receptor n=1 Tax=Pigmentiphaga humi TaxID=2478468 RepID=A0A3P4AXH5_9BURK|nr:tripartite tricarboxylate transporter substrate binding protein [Pigmentiphaga humi]VCU68769.1 Tripartite tricarboxylate transporter family receptor [Pigmentiphaga humi]